MDEVSPFVDDPVVLDLVRQYLRRVAERGGLFWEVKRGISLGCPLSPLIGAFFLTTLDERLACMEVFYVRYMDDILVLAKSRWKLRAAVKAVNEELSRLKLTKHPDKTFIGRIEKGFDFLGYRFHPAGLAVAANTLTHFFARATLHYEQSLNAPRGAKRLGEYVRRWAGGLAMGYGPATRRSPPG